MKNLIKINIFKCQENVVSCIKTIKKKYLF